ncbi:MAG TPA: plastocyanin/azurin family copper-binding protein [Gemmatimonadaceae bacterium]|nr:plastocyanin/azurin family copper-binding protein [Gemmatimonadaceae bacterium]
MRAYMVIILASVAVVGCGGGGGGGVGPNPPVFTSLQVQPDTQTIFGAPGTTTQMSATPLDQNGHTMSGLGSPTWSSSDEATATVNGTGLVTSVALGGPVTISASLTSGGVTKNGSGTVTVAAIPLTGSVTATTGQQFVPPAVTIKVGGTVTWVFQSLGHTVTFNTPTPPGTPANLGTVDAPYSNTSISRQFNTAGTFNYHCSIHPGMTGTVTVK